MSCFDFLDPRFVERRFARAIRLAFFLLSVAAADALQAQALDATLTTNEKRELQREGRLIVDLLQNLHYADRQFHQIEGKEIVDGFIERLDADKLVFTKADVEFLHRRFDRSLKTVYLLKGDLQPALEIFDSYRTRVRQRVEWINRWLDGTIDLETDEIFSATTALPPPADEAEADRRWTLWLKQAVIRERLAGRDDQEAVEQVRRAYARWAKQLAAVSAIEAREQFLESTIGLFDPHSGYFAPERADEFQIMMKGAVAGVGLDIRMDEGICVVAGLLAGGPAEEQGELRPGDEILALAGGAGEWIETKGKKLHQVIGILRGKPGESLRLAYRSPGAEGRREIALVRKDVVLVTQRARGAISHVSGNEGAAKRKIGWIELPDFYAAGEGSVDSSATRDVRELLEQMKTRGIDGLVIDLRRNPGGAMTEAVALTGLFVPSGTVLVTRGTDGKISEHNVEPAEPVYGGPLVVLTSRASASASEIFAGALRFHRRAVVAGSARTFGKGTSQAFIDLNKSPAHGGIKMSWGTLRVTGQRFYFPDGRSPQREGAMADIAFDEGDEPDAKYEEDLPHALPKDSIARAEAKPAAGDFAAVNDDLLAFLTARFAKRSAELPEFAAKRSVLELARRLATQKEFSLKLEHRFEEQAKTDAETKALRRESIRLAATIGYPTDELEIAPVRKALGEHVAFARARIREGVDPRQGWLRGNVFFIEDTGGRLQEARIERFDFRRKAVEAAKLARVFSEASGLTIATEACAAALCRAGMIEHLTDESLTNCFKETVSGVSVEDARARTGVEAILRTLTDDDPSLRAERPLIDVGLREALRMAADWASHISAARLAASDSASK